VASGYLFVGPPASDKHEDARALAKRLGCGRFDLVEIAPDGASLKIEQVRELQARVRYGPAEGDWLCVIVDRADALTGEAAAAFLKTLEEPPPRVIFILLVEREDRLPATIVSRCQRIFFGERERPWAPRPEFAPYYQELRDRRGKTVIELLELSARLEKEKERLEELLYDLVDFARAQLHSLGAVRVLLDTVKNLKKKANLKLALDNACLRLGET